MERNQQHNAAEKLQKIKLLEPSADFLFVGSKNHADKKRYRRIDPPFAEKPDYARLLPPDGILNCARHNPPVGLACPPRKMSVKAEEHALQKNHEKHQRKAEFSVFDVLKDKVKRNIQKRKHHRIPCVIIEQRQAQKACNQAQRRQVITACNTENCKKNGVYIKRNKNRLEHALFQKAFKIILFCIKALNQTEARAEEKDCDKEKARIYKNAKLAMVPLPCRHLKSLFLRNMVHNNTERRKTAQRLCNFKRSRIFVEIAFSAG